MTRGGRREGAGRPYGTTKDKRVNYHRRVKPEWVAVLDSELEKLKEAEKGIKMKEQILKELKENKNIAGVEIYMPSFNNDDLRSKGFHTDFIKSTDLEIKNVADEDIIWYEVMDEEHYNNSVLANCCCQDRFDNKEVLILCVLVKNCALEQKGFYTFRIQNTKTEEIRTLDEQDVEDKFNYDTFNDHNMLKREYDEALAEMTDDEEKQDFIETCKNYTIYDNEVEYYTAMVEYESWCSPRGVESLYKVIEVIK